METVETIKEVITQMRQCIDVNEKADFRDLRLTSTETLRALADRLEEAVTNKRRRNKRRRIKNDDPAKLLHRYWRAHYELC